MMTTQIGKSLSRFRGVLACQEASVLSDAELWQRYVQNEDEIAFESLVRRYGPMVLRVCRRILRNEQDAEDAFQATFLVLVRRAASLQKPELLANWLHGVAYRTALEVRRAAARRRVVEAHATLQCQTVTEAGSELWSVMEQELARLREQDRVVVILCDLEGKTRKEAAHQLGWAEGTVASRLTRCRTILARRLQRHGFSAARGLGRAGRQCYRGERPRTTAGFDAHKTPRPGRRDSDGSLSLQRAITLSEGVLQSMSPFKMKIAIAALLMVGVVTVGTGTLIATTSATESSDAQEPGRVKPENVQDRVVEMRRQLVEMQRKLDQLEQEAQAGQKGRGASDSSLANLFKHKVSFEIGAAEFTEGGRSEIKEVWGTRPKVEVGGQYLVRGKYVLPRGVRGKLYFYETSSGDWDNSKTATLDLQMAVADKPEGEFTLVHGMLGEGNFHLVLSDESKYSRMFANVYFGTGANVLRKMTWKE